MRAMLIIYSLAMLAASVFTLGLVPRTLRDIGYERQRLRQEAPEASFERMLEAGYRLNTLLILIEIFYYFLLLRVSTSSDPIFYGAFAFGIIHIAYLVAGRWERRRLRHGKTGTTGTRALVLSTAVLTLLEISFLVLVLFVLFSRGIP